MNHLIERLKVAIPLVVITVLAFSLPGIFGKIAFTILALGLVLPTVHEACTLLKIDDKCGYQLNLMAIITVITVTPLFCNCSIITLLVFDTVVLFMGLFIGCLLLFFHGISQKDIAVFAKFTLVESLICACLAPLPNIFYLPDHGPFLLFFLILITKLGDVGAYAIGTLTARQQGGNHKLAPTISPKKSWEGLAGGVAFSILAALLCFIFAREQLAPLGVFAVILLGLLAGIIGLIGDLAESAIKRAANVKDSGNVPGLGGIFDIMDSLLFIGPLFLAFMFFYEIYKPTLL
ncbi:MAG: phosphatidate cytidylyltransferase [Victivallales bacterium]|nr:phosphatidate cytidylyltransferase [Victivallales bacterium]